MSETDAATIAFRDGREELNAHRVAVRPDSTEWYSEDRTLRHAVATTSVQSINFEHTNAFNGTMSGAMTGLAFGGAIVFLEAMWSGFEDILLLGFLDSSWWFGAPGAPVTNVIGTLGASTIVGAVLGLGVGAIGVHLTEYLLDPSVAQPTILLMQRNHSLKTIDTTQIKLPH